MDDVRDSGGDDGADDATASDDPVASMFSSRADTRYCGSAWSRVLCEHIGR